MLCIDCGGSRNVVLERDGCDSVCDSCWDVRIERLADAAADGYVAYLERLKDGDFRR